MSPEAEREGVEMVRDGRFVEVLPATEIVAPRDVFTADLSVAICKDPQGHWAAMVVSAGGDFYWPVAPRRTRGEALKVARILVTSHAAALRRASKVPRAAGDAAPLDRETFEVLYSSVYGSRRDAASWATGALVRFMPPGARLCSHSEVAQMVRELIETSSLPADYISVIRATSVASDGPLSTHALGECGHTGDYTGPQSWEMRFVLPTHELMVCHELAHAVAHDDAHGPVFARAFIEIVTARFGGRCGEHLESLISTSGTTPSGRDDVVIHIENARRLHLNTVDLETRYFRKISTSEHWGHRVAGWITDARLNRSKLARSVSKFGPREIGEAELDALTLMRRRPSRRDRQITAALVAWSAQLRPGTAEALLGIESLSRVDLNGREPADVARSLTRSASTSNRQRSRSN